MWLCTIVQQSSLWKGKKRMALTPEESRDLAQRFHNLGARLSIEDRLRIASIAERDGYRAALNELPDHGNKGADLMVTIETAAWVVTEVFAGKMEFDVALKTLRSAAEEGL